VANGNAYQRGPPRRMPCCTWPLFSIYPLRAVVETLDHRLLRQLRRGGHDATVRTMKSKVSQDRLDEVADALDSAREAAQQGATAVANAADPVTKMLPNAQVVDLASYKGKGKTAGRPRNRMAPPARFELAHPPPEGDSGVSGERWQPLKVAAD
jgi:hypothetical protein